MYLACKSFLDNYSRNLTELSCAYEKTSEITTLLLITINDKNLQYHEMERNVDRIVIFTGCTRNYL